jgi:hypothetical protein
MFGMKYKSFRIASIINRGPVFLCYVITAGSLTKCGILTELLDVSWKVSPGAMRVDRQFILRSVEMCELYVMPFCS